MSGAANILLVDDETALQRALVPLLRSRGYRVESASGGREALVLAADHSPDLVILDLGLPDIDGLDVCARLRERSNAPIIILSARDSEPQKIAALDAGADDYVTKPFGPEELLARVRAALRRVFQDGETPSHQLVCGDLTIDIDRHRVYRQGDEIRLTPNEFDLLAFMATRSGQVLTHKTLVRAIWGPDAANRQDALRMLIGQVRKKIEVDPARPQYLLTEPWVGYRLVDVPRLIPAPSHPR